MELKKVGYCYASFNQLNKNLNTYFEIESSPINQFYTFKVETNKGLNFIVKTNTKKYKNDFNNHVYWYIFGYSAGALAKFEQHTNITALSIREYNALKGGAPYQVFKSEVK
tara:strand:+ start:85 stop:417 length:333 start_codon:yes stop_codon:yes gene_type:complete